MRRKTLFLFLLSILILLQASLVLASDLNLPEPTTSFYVYDEANILERQAEQYIIGLNEELYEKTGAQIVIASLNSLENIDIREYTNRLFEKWGIGGNEYDNGLLMLIAPQEGEIWIEVGYGLEGPLPDSKVGNIIESSILPYFRENNYSDGIISGFNEIINEVAEEYNIEIEGERVGENLYPAEEPSSDGSIFSGIKGILTAIGIIIFIFIDFKFFNGFLTYSLLLRGGRRGGRSGRGGNRGGGGRSGGGGAGGKW